MAQTYSDKPTLEAWNALAESGGIEIIKEYQLGYNHSYGSLEIDLSDIDWDDWRFVSISLDANFTAATNTLYMDLNVSLYGKPSDGLAYRTAGPMLLLLCPNHDSSARVRVLAFPGGHFAISSEDFSALTTAYVSGRATIYANAIIRVCGIR